MPASVGAPPVKPNKPEVPNELYPHKGDAMNAQSASSSRCHAARLPRAANSACRRRCRRAMLNARGWARMKGTLSVASLGLKLLLFGLCFYPAVSPTSADTIYVTTATGIEDFNSSGGTGSVFSAGGWGGIALDSGGVLYAAGPGNTIYKFG